MRSNADLNLEVKPQILATLYTPNDSITSRSLTDTDFVSNSPEWQFGTSERDIFTVGGAVISSFDFTLMNDTGRFDGINWYDARVAVTLRCLLNNSSSTTDIDMGYYYVTKHHEQGNFITVECYDALKVLDEYQIHELGITDAQWEAGLSISSLVSLIAAGPNNQVGLAVSGLSSVASSITVHNPNNYQMTLRAAISYLAQMVGQYVRINVSGGTLVFGWYDLSSTHHAGTTFNHDLRTSDITITGATVSDYKDETVIPGAGSNPIVIKDNPFIDANNAQAVYNAVNSAVTGLTFRPGSATILASPAYEPGDALLINTGQEQNIKVIATNLTYKPQVTEAITCDADPESGDLRINNLEYIKKQSQQAIDNELADPTSDLSQAIANAGGGGYDGIWVTNSYSKSSVSYGICGRIIARSYDPNTPARMQAFPFTISSYTLGKPNPTTGRSYFSINVPKYNANYPTLAFCFEVLCSFTGTYTTLDGNDRTASFEGWAKTTGLRYSDGSIVFSKLDFYGVDPQSNPFADNYMAVITEIPLPVSGVMISPVAGSTTNEYEFVTS